MITTEARSRKAGRIAAVALVFIAGLAVIEAAWAAAGHGADHHPSIWDIRWYWFNFLVYTVGMYLLLRKPASAAWHHRRDRIVAAVQGAKAELRRAEESLSAAQRRLGSLDADIRELQRSIGEETEREVRKIVEEGEKRAERIAQQARDSITLERKALESKLRKELAQLVTEKARERLRREMTPEKDRALRGAALGGIKGLLH